MGFRLLGIIDTCIYIYQNLPEMSWDFNQNFVNKDIDYKVSTTLLHKF
jgi:hypothetical protein